MVHKTSLFSLAGCFDCGLCNDLCLDSWKWLSVLYFFFLKQAGQLHVIALGEMLSTFLVFFSM